MIRKYREWRDACHRERCHSIRRDSLICSINEIYEVHIMYADSGEEHWNSGSSDFPEWHRLTSSERHDDDNDDDVDEKNGVNGRKRERRKRTGRKEKGGQRIPGNVLMGCRSSRVTQVSVINLSLAPRAQSVSLLGWFVVRLHRCRLHRPEVETVRQKCSPPSDRNFLLVINDRSWNNGACKEIR